MTRRPALALVLLLAACGPALESRRPDVVLISIDTLGRRFLRSYAPAEPALPAQDRLAARSLRLTRAYAAAPWTLPSFASLMTGLYPDRHGAIDPRTLLPGDVPLLAAALQQAGYATAGFTDGIYLGADYGFARGFEVYDDQVGEGAPARALPRQGRPSERPGEALFDRALAYLESTAGDARPLFLFLHTFSVHDYFLARPWATERLPGLAPPPPKRFLRCLLGQIRCEAAEWRTLEALYRAEIEHLDGGLERLLDALEASGRAGNAYVILLSDHGEGFDVARGRVHHGGRLHEDLIRVPLLVSGPDIAAGESALPVSLVDLMPTLLGLLDLPIPEGLDGRSLAGALRGGPAPPAAPRFAMDHYHVWRGGRRLNSDRVMERPIQLAVIDGDDWYIRDEGGEELYDMARDPEQRSSDTADAPRLGALRALANERLSEPGPRALTRQLHPALRRRLEELGYVR